MTVTSDIVAVLDEDPDLARAVGGPRQAAARRDLRAAVINVPSGRWNAMEHADAAAGGLGLLIVEGVLARRVGRARRFGAELLGPGDLLRPAEDGVELATTPFMTAWRAIEPLRLAVLDQRFVSRLAPYPEVAVALTARSVDRARHVLIHMAIAHHARVDARLELLLWHLADRWGRVTTEGVLLPLRLTHELLADLVAAQRPSVTLSLQHLERAGRVMRRDGMIYLVGEPPGAGDGDGEEDALAVGAAG
jgi:CRP-like cAMP-binding protein